MARDLSVSMDIEDKVLNTAVIANWKRPEGEDTIYSGYLTFTPLLTKAAAENKDLRIFVATGIFDLVTTFGGTEYTFNHSAIDRDRITMIHYVGGHMMYTEQASFEKLARDLRKFIRGTDG